MKKKRERGNIEKKRRRNIPVVNLEGKEKVLVKVLVTHGSYRVNVAHAVWHGLLVSAFIISCML